MMPTAATTLASTGAVRSGRETSTWTSAPRPAATRRATMTASHVGAVPGWNDGNHRGPGSVGRKRVSVNGTWIDQVFRLAHGMGTLRRPCLSSSYTYNGTVAIAAAAKLITPVPW